MSIVKYSVAILFVFCCFFSEISFAQGRAAPIYRLMLKGNFANDAISLSQRSGSQSAAENAADSIVRAKKEFDDALQDAMRASGKSAALSNAVKAYYASESAYIAGADPNNSAAKTAADEKQAALEVELKRLGF